MKSQVKINKYPFLLWLHYRKDLDIDLENQIIKSEVAESRIKRIDNWKVFLMKYLPFVLILFFGIYPQSFMELKIFLLSLLVVFISSLVLIKFLKYFKKYLILLTLIGYYIIFTNTEHIQLIDLFSVYAAELIVVAILVRDIYLKRYANYYYLLDIKKINKVNIATQHTKPLIPLWFGNKGLFRIKRGLNLGFDFSIGGYYIRIENEVK